MADENNQNNQGQQENNNDQDKNKEGTEGNNGGAGNGDDDGSKQKMIPHQKFHEERMKRQEAEKKLKAFEDAQAEANRKAEEEKGNFRKLYEETKTAHESLVKEHEETKNRLTAYETAATERINNQIQTIKSEEDRNTLSDLLKCKTLAEQETLLPKLLKKFGTSENINQSPQGSGGKSGADQETKLAEAKKSGNVLQMLENAPRINKS